MITSSLQQVNADRALATYAAMQAAMYLSSGSSLYRETTAPDAATAYLWPFSRALLGALTLAGMASSLTDGIDKDAMVRDRLAGLARYWDPKARVPAYDSAVRPPFGNGGDKYFDDNAWVALALVQAVRQGLVSSLERAEQLFAFGQSGWDRRGGDPRPGGVFWLVQDVGFGRSNHDRGGGASAGYAELGLHLHELTGSAAYDGDGEVTASVRSVGAANMLGWVSAHLDSSGTGSGPFFNLVRRDGSIDTNLWSYNQGVVIGARVLQYRLGGQASHLHLAERIAYQALETFGDFSNHPPAFNAMCFQNMLMLHAASDDAALKARMLASLHRYAEWTWDARTGARDEGSNLFAFDDGGRPARGARPANLQDQGAMTQLYALLAWDPADYARLT